MAIPVGVSLLDHFAALSDPRQHVKVLYPLPEILLLVLSATIVGADDFVETSLWGTEHGRLAAGRSDAVREGSRGSRAELLRF